jgi:dephospho-CoA kinase
MHDMFLHIKTSPDQVFIGLTGGIGSGKSTVAEIIREAGHPVLSADDIGRDITHTNEAVKASIRTTFGDDVYLPDGRLDRLKMSALVFGETAEHENNRTLLNGIVHPAVWKTVADEAAKHFRAGHRFVFNESALLFETGADTFYDRIIVVDAPEEVRVKRLAEGRNIPEDEARKRILAQIPSEEKRKKANFVIDNATTLESVRLQTHEVLERL